MLCRPYFYENALSKIRVFYNAVRNNYPLDWHLFVVEMLIGIDPSVNKSGVAVVENGWLKMCESKHLWDLFDFIRQNPNAHFYVENSNLDNGNWHGATARKNVGKNQGISQNIVDFIKSQGYKITELKPNGYSKRFEDDSTFRKITKYDQRTNKDARAAACMIWGRK